MVERRGRYLDLSPPGELSIDRENVADYLNLLSSDQPLFVGAETAALVCKGPDQWVIHQVFLVEPCELGDHLEVSKGPGIKPTACACEVASGAQPPVVQFAVTWIAIDHPRRIRLEKV